MGWSISAFNWAYALFQVPGGWLADRFGARIVLTGAMFCWAVFTAGTGLTFNLPSLAATRFFLGFGEAAAFPAGSRALRSWLPISRRAFGQGFQHSGARLGAAIAPSLVSFAIVWSGWRMAFIGLGAMGVLWAIGWFAYYRNSPREHRSVNEAEIEIISADAPIAKVRATAVPWSKILTSKDIRLLSISYFCYGWVLWLYLAWLPTYLREYHHFTLKGTALAGLPLLAATLTNIAGGIVSDRLTSKWRNVRRGRTIVSTVGYMFAALLLIPGVMSRDPYVCIAFLSAALGSLELTVPVSWAMTIDIGGEYSGSVSSVMNMCGNIGGALSAVIIGYIATHFGWTAPFVLASAMCVLSSLLVTQMNPSRTIATPQQV